MRPVFGAKKETLYEASPISYAKQKTSFPLLILNAQNDFHLGRDTKEMVAALREAGSEVSCATIPHTNHRSILELIDTPRDRVSPLIVEFIKKTLEQ